MIQVGQGYIKVNDVMGDDLKVVNTARLSFAGSSNSLEDKDKKLIRYLAANKHMSPFRGCFVTFEIEMPLFVKYQWIKHIIGGEYQFKDTQFNEVSRRYTSKNINTWWPKAWREQSEDNKQASVKADWDEYRVNAADSMYFNAIQTCLHAYDGLIAAGVCREQARAVLPEATYTKVVWTAGLQAITNFIELRDHPHAQQEIRDYAVAMKELVTPLFPTSMEALLDANK